MRKQRRYFIELLAVFVITGMFLVVNSARSSQKAEMEAMKNRVHEFQVLMKEWLGAMQDTLQIMGYELQQIPEPQKNLEMTAGMLAELDRQAEFFSDVYIYDPSWGGLITKNGFVSDEGLPQGILDAYQGAVQQKGKLFITKPYMAKTYQVYCVTLSKALYKEDGSLRCVAYVDCYLDKLIGILSRCHREDGYAFLADRELNIINHPYAAYQMRMDRVTNAMELPYREAFEKDGIRLICDYDGTHRVCSVFFDAATGFYIVTLENWDRVYGAVLRSTALYVTAILLGSVLVTLLLRSWSKSQEDATRTLQEAARESERASRAKSTFLAGITHEIRTPIHTILGMNEMIEKETIQPEIREYTAHIDRAGNSLLSMINTVLDFSRLESEKIELFLGEYILRESIEVMENMVAFRAREKDLLFVIHVDEKLPARMIGDITRIQQIILNLLSNAVKYTKEGQVCLTVRLLEQTGSQVRLRVEVSDTGIGIRKEDLGRLCRSFERIDEEKNRHIEGTGLGLAIAQRLLHMMGSTLEVDSQYGIGSIFSFELEQKAVGTETVGPDWRRSELEEQGRISFREKKLRGRILAVDDVELNLLVLKNFLADTGVELDTAASGEEALEYLRVNTYDLLLLDHRMPEFDGLETMERIEQEHLADGMICIALTANAAPGARQQYLEVGFDDYLTKPISARGLFAILDRYLGAERRVRISRQDQPIKKTAFINLVASLIPELDLEAAIEYCGESEKFFREILEEYVANRRDIMMDEAFFYGNWDSYRILAHSLKSTSRMVGLITLSDHAREMEQAVRDTDFSYVKQQHEPLIAEYRNLLHRLEKLLDQAFGKEVTL